MEEWGQPLTLLILIWGALGQILIPMAMVIGYNNPRLFNNSPEGKDLDQGFFMNCEEAGHSFEVKSACDWTAPAVRLFPILGISLPVLLALWKLLHMRAYYVLMRNRIMISFREGKRLGFKCGMGLAVIFLHALAHFCLKVVFGEPCNDASCNGQHILNTGWKDFLQDPSSLEKDRTFIMAATKLAVQYIVPGTLSLIFLFSMDDFVAELVPMGLYFSTKSGTRYRELAQYLHVKEEMMDLAVRQLRQLSLPPCHFEDVSAHLHKILEDKSCRRLGDSEETEKPDEEMSPEGGSLLRGLRELVLLEWWPIQLLIDLPLTDQHSYTFNAFMTAHLLVTNAIISFGIFVMFRRMLIMIRENMASNEGRFSFSFSTMYPMTWYFMLGSISCVALCRTVQLMVQLCRRVAAGPSSKEEKSSAVTDLA